MPVSACPTTAVRSPIGSDFQLLSLASETNRLNWSCPLKTVLNGNRVSTANAVAQIKTMGTINFEAVIADRTEIEIAARSSNTDPHLPLCGLLSSRREVRETCRIIDDARQVGRAANTPAI